MSILNRISGLFRRSAENPAIPLSDADAFLDYFGGPESSSGVRINRGSALTYSPVWRAVNLISRDVAKLPLFVYERTDDGKNRATVHPSYSLLRWKPNSEMTSYVFRQVLMASTLLDGNGYAYILRDRDANAVELIPLMSDRVTPVRENGRLLYVVTLVTGEQRKVLAENMLHVKGLGFDGLVGYSPIQKARNSLGVGMAAEEFGGRYFSNDAKPGVVLEHPGKLSDQAAKRLRESWSAMHKGLSRAHSAAILEEGMKVNPFSHNARDSQLLELRQFQVRDVANWFGVPPHKLGDTTRTAFASLEQENQSYLDDALDGWLVAWEEECREKLLTEQQKREDTHFIEFERKALVRADLKTRSEYYAKALGGAPWMVVDEVRSLENMNDLPDGVGEIYQRPLNMAQSTTDVVVDPANDPVEPQIDPPARSKDITNATRAVLVDALKRMAKRLATHARKAAKVDLVAWSSSGMNEHRAVLVEAITPAVVAHATASGGKADVAAVVEMICRSFAEDIRSAGADSIDLFESEMPAVIAEKLETSWNAE